MTFSFHEGFPKEPSVSFDPGIFHDVKHLQLQASSGWRSFYIQNNDFVEGIFQVHIDGTEALSPYKSPFGSFLFSDEVSQSERGKFIGFCEAELKRLGVKTIVLKNQPEDYAGQNEFLTNILLASGYSIQTEETSAIISITQKAFDSKLHKSEKKRLRKCRESNLLFEQIGFDRLEKIYFFLEACRQEKGYSLSMSFEGIQKLAQTFPDRLILTSVVDKNQLAAANISIRIYDYVLYNFYHDHSSEYDHLSPVVLLNEGLYQFCQKENIQYLDLGTSNIDDKLNESLLNFKLHLGAIPSRKLTFIKNLE